MERFEWNLRHDVTQNPEMTGRVKEMLGHFREQIMETHETDIESKIEEARLK